MAQLINGLINTAQNIVSGAQSVLTNVAKGVAPVTGREYFEAGEQSGIAPGASTAVVPQPKTAGGIWSSLPKINPRVLAGGNGYTGLIDLELIRNTSSSWDPRGESDAVKKIQNVTIPGYLVNDRNLTAAQQRSWNRDSQGSMPFQI